jgi:hypothetical protein
MSKYEGTIQGITEKPFYMVFVEGGNTPQVKHEEYNDAFLEMVRLSKKENKKSYVVKVVSMCELTPNIIQYEN